MKLLHGLVYATLVTCGAAQTDLQLIVEQALDQPVDLQIGNAPLYQAFETISQETGVTITIPAEAVELLPHGSATQVTAKLRNLSLREGLVQLLAPLGMAYRVTAGSVELFPVPGLRRIGRRATWPELKTLQWLQTTRFGDDPDSLGALQQRVQFQVAGAKPWHALSATVKKVGAGAGSDVLEIATRSLGWTWYPSGEQIVVVSLTDQVRRQLDTVISVRKSHRPLTEVLRHVGRQAGVTIRLAPGVADALPVQVRKNFSLLAENVTAAEALEEIAGLTGLTYRADANGVALELSGGLPGTAAAMSVAQPAARRRDPYVAKITVPDPSGVYQFDFLLRESDLSPEVNELRKKLIEEADEAIEEALKKRLETEPAKK